VQIFHRHVEMLSSCETAGTPICELCRFHSIKFGCPSSENTSSCRVTRFWPSKGV
jgi:hypothetical protein